MAFVDFFSTNDICVALRSRSDHLCTRTLLCSLVKYAISLGEKIECYFVYLVTKPKNHTFPDILTFFQKPFQKCEGSFCFF